MVLRRHKCPHCGGSSFEAYRQDTYIIIRCETCNAVLQKHEVTEFTAEVMEIKNEEESILHMVAPLFLGMMIFTLVFAFIIRMVLAHLGIYV